MNKIKNPLLSDCTFQSYLAIKNLPVNAFTFFDKFGEGGTDVYFTTKSEGLGVENALYALLLTPAMRYGDYAATNEAEEEIFKLNLKALAPNYLDEFPEVASSKIRVLQDRTQPDRIRKSAKNYNWSGKVDRNEWLSLTDFRSAKITVYQMMDHWNHEELFIQTDDYFIRWTWATAA
ncbi:MAG: hypothetical protein AAFP77_13855 [Bacteroidota bacterium]